MVAKKQAYTIKTKYGNFQAQIWNEVREKLYLVEIPSFDNSMTQGSSLAEAKRMAKDLIELLSEAAFDDGKVVVDDDRRVVGRGKLARISGPASIEA